SANRVCGCGEFGVLAGLTQSLGLVFVPDEITGGLVLFGGLGDLLVLIGGSRAGCYGRGGLGVLGVAWFDVGVFDIGRDILLEVVEVEGGGFDVDVFARFTIEVRFGIEFIGGVGVEGVHVGLGILRSNFGGSLCSAAGWRLRSGALVCRGALGRGALGRGAL